MPIEWKDVYKTGNVQIDAQHMQWFNKVNFFLETTDKESRTRAATKLYQYTRLHFQDEENLMQLTSFPAAREHIRRHNDALVHMGVLLEQIADDTLNMEKWSAFLADLFRNHIGDADLKFAAFITNQKRAAKRNAGNLDSPFRPAEPEENPAKPGPLSSSQMVPPVGIEPTSST
jgi:hemerythrin-like metal-binding protein